MASTRMESPATLQAGNLFSVTGLIAVVTGGGTGIGLLITKALVANGATVYILGRRGDVLRQAAQSIGVEAVKPVICDVTSKASLTSAVNVISADTGYINLLICNAGISGPQTHLPSSEHQISVEDFSRVNMDVSIEDYTRTFRANVVATWYTTMAFLRLLDAGNRKGNVRQKSQVVAITSIAAFNKDVSTLSFPLPSSFIVAHFESPSIPERDVRPHYRPRGNWKRHGTPGEGRK
ncbi:short chain dehydrogenase/reductase family [Verticillium dahliae VdLs.17]|uniref:Short chain dehydrogenase/reductase family n=1 Tax=Verticillium dahliae (strain VdLs.17 / ATCC MYA-4575 / FGSC 10137) TaxID=498257 RepID=G2X0U2_VERDV|nr:short chain dehydrogenase/reductase family [Verticillium dahliae VdLs.17]EGY22433.1 short chain dehydrogenase/reductase family [Verticillium dahliae VdLs.17]